MSLETENPASAPATPVENSTSETGTAFLTKAGGKRFDFRHPVFLSSGEWRKIRIEVEEFVESVGALISTYLRLDFTLQLGKLDTVNFTEFAGGLPNPTHLTLFKLEPLRGISVMEIRPGIGLGIVDRLLGGPGKPASLDRNLTEMEVALMDQFVQIVLGEWCKQWIKLQELRAEILGHENNPKFLQSSSGETVMLVLTLEARMDECVGQIQLAIPYSTIEPLVNKLTDSLPAPASATPQPASVKWNKNLDNLPLRVSAYWPSFRLPTRELLKLKVGDVLDLQPQGAEKIELRLGKTGKFRGRLGTRDNKWAIQITEISKL